VHPYAFKFKKIICIYYGQSQNSENLAFKKIRKLLLVPGKKIISLVLINISIIMLLGLSKTRKLRWSVCLQTMHLVIKHNVQVALRLFKTCAQLTSYAKHIIKMHICKISEGKQNSRFRKQIHLHDATRKLLTFRLKQLVPTPNTKQKNA